MILNKRIGIILLCLFFMASCTNNISKEQIAELQNKVMEVQNQNQVLQDQIIDLQNQETEPQIVCNKPYLLVGTSCCLDEDDNNICDIDDEMEIVMKDVYSINEKITAVVKTKDTIYISSYGPWTLYKKVTGEWEKVLLESPCVVPCTYEDACEKGPISCAQGMPSAECEETDTYEVYNWDQREIFLDYIECSNKDDLKCYWNQWITDDTKYKLVFSYREDCVEEDNEFYPWIEEGVKSIEKEFESK